MPETGLSENLGENDENVMIIIMKSLKWLWEDSAGYDDNGDNHVLMVIWW